MADGGRIEGGWWRSLAIVGSSCLLLGCGASERLIPLAVGKKWNYRFRWPLQREVGRIEVVREVPIDRGTGWELQSPMGVARLGYVGDRLVADQLGGAFLTPPLPIGLPTGAQTRWAGWVQGLTGRQPAKATIVATEAKLDVGGRRRTLDRTVVSMTVEGRNVELTTWYAPGDGIVQQEQRTKGNLDIGIERITGD